MCNDHCGVNLKFLSNNLNYAINRRFLAHAAMMPVAWFPDYYYKTSKPGSNTIYLNF